MKFALAALVAGLLATPGAGQHVPSFAVSEVACNELDRFMLSVTNNTCSIKLQNAPEVCTPFIEKFATTSPKIVAEMQKLEEACKEEMIQTKTMAVLKHLKSEHKKNGCNRKILNVEEKYICKKINDDTKAVNKILENNR